jgi:NAD(P)-dependent dehydrogenase (short-subunit alcohol dehydrogenase family)
MSLTTDLKGKAALVTGAASGLGRATALAVARAGGDAFLVDLNAGGLDETARAVRELGVRAEVFAGDLSAVETCRAAVAGAVAAFGRLDALLSIAGMLKFAHAAEMDPADWQKTLAVNLSAPFFLFQAAIAHLIAAEGAVVNVTSSASFVGEAYLAAYCASKAGLTHLTKSLAMEYSSQPVRINAVAPGGMATNIAAGTSFPEGMDFSLIQRFSGLRGMVEVEEVAEMIAYLASPAAQGFHGACISMDRGITAG